MPRPTSLPTSTRCLIASWPMIDQKYAPGMLATMSPAWPKLRATVSSVNRLPYLSTQR